ncbi:MAG TPA: hypothetical protein VGF25_01135 [Thermoleophilaceae bacterium]
MEFPVVLRGYDRQAVDDYVAEVAQLVAELEATQLRESVVQRALDEVGEQTSSILQRAHEAAEEIAARSRAQAEGRIQRAEREAEITRRDADEYSEQVVVDTKKLWDERQRLLEEIRQLADEVLATADDALDRVKEPEMLRREREAAEQAAAAAASPHPLDEALDEGPSVVARDPVVGPGDDSADEADLAGEAAPIGDASPAGDFSPTTEDASRAGDFSSTTEDASPTGDFSPTEDAAPTGDPEWPAPEPLRDDAGLGAEEEVVDEEIAAEEDELGAGDDESGEPEPGEDQPTAEFKPPGVLDEEDAEREPRPPGA